MVPLLSAREVLHPLNRSYYLLLVFLNFGCEHAVMFLLMFCLQFTVLRCLLQGHLQLAAAARADAVGRRGQDGADR